MNDAHQSRLPSLYDPWYVVFKTDEHGKFSYFSSITDGTPAEMWTKIAGLARTFVNVRDAARVAIAEQAMIRALVSREDGKEFGHDDGR